MRAVIQRVSQAKVEVDSAIVGKIEHGLMVLLGIEELDTDEDISWLANKLLSMRIFSDQDDKMNLSIQDIDGQFLVISQFTLFASTKKGNRPSFIQAAKPDIAIPLYKSFVEYLDSNYRHKTQVGIFGADMKVSLTNDGPVTIVIDSKNKE